MPRVSRSCDGSAIREEVVVSVVIFFTVAGDTEQLLAAYDKTLADPHPSRLGIPC
jgi:hypothetical protein